MPSRNRAVWLLLACLAAYPAAAQETVRLPGGITLAADADGALQFGNARLRLRFDGAGRWTALEDAGGLRLAAPAEAAVDVRADSLWLGEAFGLRYDGHTLRLDPYDGSATLVLRYRTGPEGRFTLASAYRLLPDSAALWRTASVQHDAAGGAVRLEGFRFRLGGAQPGPAGANVVNAPGPWFPNTYLRPDAPVEALAERPLALHSAPDAGFGFAAVTDTASGRTLAVWMNTAGETNYHARLRARGSAAAFEADNHRYYRLPAAVAAPSDTFRVAVTPSLEASLAAYRASVGASLPLAPATPAWVREMVLLEVYPAYYPGGFREIAARLPGYREAGFNTIYLMPHWLGGYSPIDLFAVDPAYGSEADLQHLVGEAHRLGMRVLFDMVIHGFNERSPVVAAHPELFIRGADGAPVRHPTWRSISTDWAAPTYHAYMARLVAHDAATYGIDGYRVDAAAYKGPNWDPGSPHAAYRSGAASPALMRTMRTELRRRNPEAVLLSEVFGPVFLAADNLGHDNQTEAAQQFLELLAEGKVTAADYRKHLERVRALLPEGANRVYFARNHDTSWFYHFNGYTPAFRALDALHAFVGIPEVFAGDPKNPPHPEADVLAFYRRLFAFRQAHPEFAHGALRFLPSDCPNVVSLMRSGPRADVLAVVSLSDKPETVRLLPEGGAPLRLVDVLTGAPAPVSGRRVQVQPYQILAGARARP